MKMLDLFGGIGGFHLGFKQAGFKIDWSGYSEIDKYASAVYRKKFNNIQELGDVKSIRSKDIPKIDFITFGSPCQDFSLAGKRTGMEGDRSSLITEAIRLINECRPRFFVWENVKGTFSSNDGRDFWAIIKAFTNIGGYRLEWQLLNTLWFLPQNRERIYLVGVNRERPRRKIFPIKENCSEVDANKTKEYTNTITARYNASTGTGSYISQSRQFPQKEMIGDFRYDEGIRIRKEFNSPCLNTRNIPLYINKRMRKLTMVECERLQGFPDNWTQKGIIENKEVEISDNQRYKQCGNAVTVNVVEAVARKIKKYFE